MRPGLNPHRRLHMRLCSVKRDPNALSAPPQNPSFLCSRIPPPHHSMAHYNQALQLTRQLGGVVAYPSPYARGRSAYKVPRGEPCDAPAGWRDQVRRSTMRSMHHSCHTIKPRKE